MHLGKREKVVILKRKEIDFNTLGENGLPVLEVQLLNGLTCEGYRRKMISKRRKRKKLSEKANSVGQLLQKRETGRGNKKREKIGEKGHGSKILEAKLRWNRGVGPGISKFVQAIRH